MPGNEEFDVDMIQHNDIAEDFNVGEIKTKSIDALGDNFAERCQSDKGLQFFGAWIGGYGREGRGFRRLQDSNQINTPAFIVMAKTPPRVFMRKSRHNPKN